MTIRWLHANYDGAQARLFGWHRVTRKWAYLQWRVADAETLHELHAAITFDSDRIERTLKALGRLTDDDDVGAFVDECLDAIRKGGVDYTQSDKNHRTRNRGIRIGASRHDSR